MSSLKIGVYAIMRDESAQVDEWVDSVHIADHVVVLDTGSKDGTVRRLDHAMRREGLRRFQIAEGSINPWRFDVAHNAALALMPADIDICVPLAADERMNKDWYDCIQDAALPVGITGPTKFTYRYQFAPGLSFTHDRIHSRNGFHWRYPFHEGIYPYGEEPEKRVHVPALKITQQQNGEVDRGKRDLILAEIALKEFPHDPRMTFYAGRQFMYAGDIDRALILLHKYFHVARQANHVHPVEAQWCAEAIAQCYKMKAGT